MLLKENRLKKKKDFEKVFKTGKGYKEDFLLLKIRENNLKTSRFGFVVSKKFSKKALIRNRIKRQLRELVKLKLSKIKKGIDAVILTVPALLDPGQVRVLTKLSPAVKKQGLKDKDFCELEEIINKLFKKAGILR